MSEGGERGGTERVVVGESRREGGADGWILGGM